MLKQFAKVFLIFMGLTSLPSCGADAGFRAWQEEVRLSDGRVIVVTQTRRCESAYTGKEVAPCISRETWLTINLPEFSKQEIVWNEKLDPRVLNIHEGKLYVVGWPTTGREFDLYGKPQPPYIGYRWTGKVWERISLQEIPEAIYSTNMIIDLPPKEIKFLTLARKESFSMNGSPDYRKHHRRIDPTYKSNF